jgi:hypothetical protein
MPPHRYRCTWDDIAWLDCDHMASWGAFEAGRRETIDFDDDDLPKLAFTMDDNGAAFSATYQWRQAGQRATGDYVHARVHLKRRPCRFGGWRTYFICPCCGRGTLRLAVLPEGLRCGTCGRVTWASRRQRRVDRLIRKANKISLKLGCDSWMDSPDKRPLHMRVAAFERLKAEQAALVAEINRDIARKLSRKHALFTALARLSKSEA